MRNVLVTGGAGFIGSYICKLFYENGFVPITFDNLLLGNRWAVKWGLLKLVIYVIKKIFTTYLINILLRVLFTWLVF